MTLDQLNALDADAWVAALGGIFEHSPWVAQRAFERRPYSSRGALLEAMRSAVAQATAAEQLTLIRAHPQLGLAGRAASALTPASAREQRRAGLNACTPAQLARLQQLNARYQQTFGFPFILAVRGHDPASIIAQLERRLGREPEAERQTALQQIGGIAAYRLADLVVSPPEAEIAVMLERLARLQGAADAASQAGAMVREWMQAAGLEVSATVGRHTGQYLVGRLDGATPDAVTVLAGACCDPGGRALHYQGRTPFVIAIAAAQQLRHAGKRPACGLAVLARPEDPRVGNPGAVPEDDALRDWIELRAPDESDALDGETGEILQALRAAELMQVAALLVRRADPADASRTVSRNSPSPQVARRAPGPASRTTPIDAQLAAQAVRALQAILGCGPTAA